MTISDIVWPLNEGFVLHRKTQSKPWEFFLFFPLFTEHNCAVIDVRVPAAQWSIRRNRSNQSDLVIPSPSAHGELLLIRPDHGPRAYPHAARDTSSLKGAAGPGEWRMREPKRSGVRQWPAQASLNHLSDLRSCQLPCKNCAGLTWRNTRYRAHEVNRTTRLLTESQLREERRETVAPKPASDDREISLGFRFVNGFPRGYRTLDQHPLRHSSQQTGLRGQLEKKPN